MIWCLGLYASGSTWVFNAAMKIAAILFPARPIAGLYVTALAELNHCDGPATLVIAKSHDAELAAAGELRRRATTVLLSIRDPRDCVTSLMLYQGHSLAAALRVVERSTWQCLDLLEDRRTTLLRYEDGFVDAPATLDRIAGALGGELAPSDRDRIFAETRRQAIERHIAGLATLPTALRDRASGDVVDTATQWHTHHAQRSGEVGRWRHMLTLPEAAAVEDRLAPSMAALGYRAEILPLTRPVGSTLRL